MAESTIVSVPVLGPMLVGVKVRKTLHVSPGEIVTHGPGTVEKSPLVEMLEIVIGISPMLRSVMNLGVLVVLMD